MQTDENENYEIIELIKAPMSQSVSELHSAQDLSASINSQQSQFSLLSSIGKFFSFKKEEDSCLNLLGVTFDQFTEDRQHWLKVIDLATKFKLDSIPHLLSQYESSLCSPHLETDSPVDESSLIEVSQSESGLFK